MAGETENKPPAQSEKQDEKAPSVKEILEVVEANKKLAAENADLKAKLAASQKDVESFENKWKRRLGK